MWIFWAVSAFYITFYRPPDKTNEDYLNKVKEEISTIKEKHRRDIFVIGGDFNLPDINWEEQTIINRQYPMIF
jgi:menaquinone-dependent protoporphyrinogen IX oxidase